MCAAPKFDTWTHEKLARAREHPSNHVERRTHVSPSSRRLATCASAASASTSTDSHRRPPWTKSWHCRTAPQTWSCTSRTTANAGACGSPSRVRNSRAPSGVSLTENPNKENASQSPRPPTEGTSCSSRKFPPRPLACTCLHTRTLQSCLWN